MSRLLSLEPGGYVEVEALSFGQLGAIVGPRQARTGDTLCAPEAVRSLGGPAAAGEPVGGVVDDEVDLRPVLRRLAHVVHPRVGQEAREALLDLRREQALVDADDVVPGAQDALVERVHHPLVVYARKDTPPGLKTATDILKAREFKALSLNVQNSNTLSQALSLDLLGIKYQAVPAYRGLKEVETAILQNIGQLANTSLPGWLVAVPRRHQLSLAELEPEAAAELGPLLTDLTRALQHVTGCLKTYVILLAEAEGFAHLHFHVVPRMPGQPAEERGPRIFARLGAPADEQVQQPERDRLARDIREALDR